MTGTIPSDEVKLDLSRQVFQSTALRMMALGAMLLFLSYAAVISLTARGEIARAVEAGHQFQAQSLSDRKQLRQMADDAARDRAKIHQDIGQLQGRMEEVVRRLGQMEEKIDRTLKPDPSR